MDLTAAIVGLILGLALGAGLVWLISRTRAGLVAERLRETETALAQARQDLEGQSQALAELRAEKVRLETILEHERKASAEKLTLLEEAKEKLREAFKAVSADALRDSSQSFLELAQANLQKFQAEAKGDLEQKRQAVENLVRPIRESLDKVTSEVQSLERARQQAYGSLNEQVKSLGATQERLQQETANLALALRSPSVRGQWGEMHLRRAVEMAGMTEYCDFVEQESAATEEGLLRPDMLIKLPGNKNVVVDAKAPFEAYLQAQKAPDEAGRRKSLQEHARRTRIHVNQLGSRKYWRQFEPTPEFVVMFLPGEFLFSAALEQDPTLLDAAASQQVILASPTTLIALLRSVAYGWQQEALAQNARKIRDLGRDLHERLSTLSRHFASVGQRLDQAVRAYNEAVGSLERRVLPSARRFADLGVTREEIRELAPVERSARALQAPELAPASEGPEDEAEEDEP